MKNLKVLEASFGTLALKVKNLHWNLNEEFFTLHKQLDKLYEDVNDFTDRYAEKLVMLDNLALGSFEEMKELSLIKEVKSKWFSAKEVKETVVNDLTLIIDYVLAHRDEEETCLIDPLYDDTLEKLLFWRWNFKKA